MPFLETPRFPTDLRFGLVGGPEFATEIITVNSGNEQRNSIWSVARGRWQADYGPYDAPTKDALIAFFRAVKGRANGFRFRDPADYNDLGLGILGAGVGTGLPTQKLVKRYSSGALSNDRPITKPVAGSVKVYANAVLQAGATVDSTTGVVTLPASASLAVSTVTVGAVTTITTAAVHGLTTGKIVYITGISGTAAALLNAKAWTITVTTTTAFTIAQVTTGLTATGGTVAVYPQPADILTWTGDFDVPVRFDTDRLEVTAVDRGYFSVQGLILVETRL